MTAKLLMNSEALWTGGCQFKTLKLLVKFRNLEFVCLDFDPLRDELAILNESKTLESILISTNNYKVKLLRTAKGPKVHKNFIIRGLPQTGPDFRV